MSSGRAPEGPEPCPITGCDRTFLTVASANIHQNRVHGDHAEMHLIAARMARRRHRWLLAHDPDYRAAFQRRASEGQQKRWSDADDTARHAHVPAALAALAAKRADPKWRQKTRTNLSKMMRQRWQDPDFRARWMKARWGK
jgi:hypothetical protein